MTLVDELYSFIGKKSRVSLFMAVKHYMGLIVGQAVLWNIDAAILQAVIDGLPGADRYYSDDRIAYAALKWPGLHEVSVGKRDTHTLERRNSELRHYLARLHHKTKCYVKPGWSEPSGEAVRVGLEPPSTRYLAGTQAKRQAVSAVLANFPHRTAIVLTHSAYLLTTWLVMHRVVADEQTVLQRRPPALRLRLWQFADEPEVPAEAAWYGDG